MALSDALFNSIKIQGVEEPDTHDGSSTTVHRVDRPCHGVIHDCREGAELVEDAAVIIGAEQLRCAGAANRWCEQGTCL